MRYSLIIIFISIVNIIHAQDKYVVLKLHTIENRKKAVPFFFKEVVFATDVSDTSGIIATKKNFDNIFAGFEKDKSKAILDFLSAQFEQDKNSTPIIIEINKLKLAATEKGVFNFKDTFQFQCDFYGILNNEKVPFYTFNAKNPFGTFKDAENVMSNYVTRALVTSIEKFKEFYEINTVWHKDFANKNDSSAEQIQLKVNTVLNNLSSKDSVACESGYKLTWNDFQENTKDNTGQGSARFILTYKVATEETSKQLKLDIYVSAFFNKKTSWKPKNTSQNSWLDYHQGHFDICCVYGHKLYTEMKNYKYSPGEYKAELNKIYNDIYTEYIKLRKQYETETESGSNIIQTAVWRKKIDEMIIDIKQ